MASQHLIKIGEVGNEFYFLFIMFYVRAHVIYQNGERSSYWNSKSRFLKKKHIKRENLLIAQQKTMELEVERGSSEKKC